MLNFFDIYFKENLKAFFEAKIDHFRFHLDEVRFFPHKKRHITEKANNSVREVAYN